MGYSAPHGDPMKKRHTTTHGENRARLARVEGQVRAVRRMVEEGAYCIDLVNQIEAARSALREVGRRILRKHLEHCVADAMRSGSRAAVDRKIAELMDVLRRCQGS
jgi:DNA-binding FrmR family transcriptional regulator